MDIASLSMSLSQANIGQAVSIGLTKMANDNALQQGQALTKMMEQSVQPNLGQSIDIRV